MSQKFRVVTNFELLLLHLPLFFNFCLQVDIYSVQAGIAIIVLNYYDS